MAVCEFKGNVRILNAGGLLQSGHIPQKWQLCHTVNGQGLGAPIGGEFRLPVTGGAGCKKAQLGAALGQLQSLAASHKQVVAVADLRQLKCNALISGYLR